MRLATGKGDFQIESMLPCVVAVVYSHRADTDMHRRQTSKGNNRNHRESVSLGV